MENQKTAFLTGATGMLGSKLALDLLENNYKVKAIFRSKNRIKQFTKNVGFYCKNPEEKVKLIDWVEGDVLDYPKLLENIKGCDIVFHSAAMVSFYPADYQTMYNININGTSNLVNACLETGVKKICFVSSIAALGKKQDGSMINEKTHWVREKNHSGYGISKFHSEMEVWRGINEGLEAVIVNPSVILGPGEWQTGSPAFFNNIAKGMKFYPGGGTGFVDVRDVSAIMIMLCSNENWEKAHNKKYLLNAANLSYKAVFELIAQTLHVKAPSLKATKTMMEIAWRAAWVAGKITGRKPLITKGNVRNANKTQLFDGSKVTSEFAFCYTPIEKTIHEVGQMYLIDHKKRGQ